MLLLLGIVCKVVFIVGALEGLEIMMDLKEKATYSEAKERADGRRDRSVLVSLPAELLVLACSAKRSADGNDETLVWLK